MNRNLNNINWKQFKLKDIIVLDNNKNKVQVPTGSNINKNLLTKGTIPRITVKQFNNGIDDFYKDNVKGTRKYKNFISVSFLGNAFYHSYLATTDMKVHTLKLKGVKLNKYIALFFIAMLNNNIKNFSFGDQLSSTDIPLKKILLPTNSKGQPDYEFMEEYIKEKETKLKQEYKNFIQKRIKKLQSKVKPNKKYKPFLIYNIFETVQRGKRLIKGKQIKGKTPYISSTATNNGIDNFISNDKNIRKFKNCLSLANSGSVGTCFYEPFEFIASDHVTHLKGNFTKYTYLFLANMLNRLSEKYNFNREINDPRIQKEYILLPINSKNEPDYEYMNNYMLYLEQKKILEYLDFIK